MGENPKDFTTRLLPGSRDQLTGSAPQTGTALLVETGWGAPGTAPRVATTPTTTDLYALEGGRDRLLKVREAADQLRIGTWAIYSFCETGELAHIRIIDSIRIRPADLAAFAAARLGKVHRK